MEEMWYDIKGYEGYYQISNLFRIKSLNRHVPHPLSGKQFVKGRILKPSQTLDGYYFYALMKNNIRSNCFLHHLIGNAFIPNPENKPCINHKNGVKTDYRIDNLEWATYSENAKHAFANGLKYNKKGADDELSKSIIAINLKTNEEIVFGSQREASRILGIRQSAIWRLLNSQLKNNTYNYIFKYADSSISV